MANSSTLDLITGKPIRQIQLFSLPFAVDSYINV